MPLGLVEVILFFGVVLVWSWIEYRKADRLAKNHKPPGREKEPNPNPNPKRKSK